MMNEYVWLVYLEYAESDGKTVLGVFSKVEQAQKVADVWNNEHCHTWVKKVKVDEMV